MRRMRLAPPTRSVSSPFFTSDYDGRRQTRRNLLMASGKAFWALSQENRADWSLVIGPGKEASTSKAVLVYVL